MRLALFLMFALTACAQTTQLPEDFDASYAF